MTSLPKEFSTLNAREHCSKGVHQVVRARNDALIESQRELVRPLKHVRSALRG